MRKNNPQEGKTPTKKPKPGTPRSSTSTPRSNLEPPKSNSSRRKSNRPFSPSITAPTASSVARNNSHPYAKINWNDESSLLQKFPLQHDRGVLSVPKELLQSRYTFMDKAKVVREWRSLYPDEQLDIAHQWSLQRKKLKGQVQHTAASANTPPLPQSIDANNDNISPKRLDFQSSISHDAKTKISEDDAMKVDEKDNSNDDIHKVCTATSEHNQVANDSKEIEKQKKEMLLHEQFDNVGLTINNLATTPNKKHFPSKEEPMYFESTMSVGKSRHSSASSISSSGIVEEPLSPVIDTTKMYEEITNINNTIHQHNNDDDAEMQIIEQEQQPTENNVPATNNVNKSFNLEEESAMYFESTMSIGKSKCDDSSSLSSTNVVDDNENIRNVISETLVQIEELDNMKQL